MGYWPDVAAHMIKPDPDWCCSGCGVLTPERVRACDCVTDSLYQGVAGKLHHAGKIDLPARREFSMDRVWQINRSPAEAQNARLAALRVCQLLGKCL